MTTPLVSVVVPTYRRPELLHRCLQALLSQQLEPDAFEVIVVDDGADPETQAVVESWAYQADLWLPAAGAEAVQTVSAPPALAGPASAGPAPATATAPDAQAVVEPEKPEPHSNGKNGSRNNGHAHLAAPRLRYLPAASSRGPAAARNLGWQAARGEIIAFTDDDCIPTPTWLQHGLRAMSAGAAGASGRVIVPLPPRPTDYELSVGGLERSHFLTAACFYRRSILEAEGGFDERFHLAWREDSDLYFRLRQRSCLLVEAPQAVVIHPVRPAPWGVSLSQQRKSQYNALLYKKHPQLYRTLQPHPPWHYYAILASILLFLSALLAGAPWIAGLAAGLWLLQTLRFAFLRLQHTRHSPGHIAEMLFTSALIPPLCIFWRLRGAIRYRVIFF